MTQGGDQFEGGGEIGDQGRLGGDPGFGVEGGLIEDPSLPGAADDDAAIDQEQEDGDAAGERGLRPVARTGKVVLQADAHVPRRFLDQRLALLVVAMATVMGQSIDPLPGEVTDG